jgi:hypothetical protein
MPAAILSSHRCPLPQEASAAPLYDQSERAPSLDLAQGRGILQQRRPTTAHFFGATQLLVPGKLAAMRLKKVRLG